MWGVALAVALAAPTPAAAAPACGVTAMTDLAFGDYDPFLGVAVSSTARVRLNCPRGQAPRVLLSAGNSGAFAWRELRSASDVLRYNVYQDAARTVIWGDGTGGSAAFVSATGNAQLTLYGSIPPGQDPTEGTYTDVLTLTVVL